MSAANRSANRFSTRARSWIDAPLQVPASNAPLRRSHGAIDVLGAGRRQGTDRATGGGVHDRHRLAMLGGRFLARR